MSETLSELDVANAATATAAEAGAGTETTPADGAAPAVEPAVPTPEPAAPAINWNDLELLNQAAEAIQRLGYTIAPNTPEAPQPQADPEYDPFDKASVDAYIQSKLDAAISPLSERQAQIDAALAAERAAEANALVDSRIELAIDAAQLAPAEGQTAEQLHAAVNAIANQFASTKLAALGRQPVGQEAQRLGDESITEAVAFLNAIRAAATTQGAEQYRQDLTRDGSHLLEPGVRGTGIEGTQPPTSELDVARRFMSAR